MTHMAGVQRPPKQQQAVYAYMDEHWTSGDHLKKVVEDSWLAGEVSANAEPTLTFRLKVCREAFKKLSPAKQREYTVQVQEKAIEAKDAYKRALKAGPAKDPASRAK